MQAGAVVPAHVVRDGPAGCGPAETGPGINDTAVVDRDLVCITAGRGRPSREGITLA